MSRLTLLHINIIGVVVAIIVGVGLYFTLITNALEAKKTAEAANAEVAGRAQKLAGNKTQKANAEKEAAAARTDYARFEGQYMPTIGYISDPMVNMIKNFWPNSGRSWPERYIRAFRTHMNREQRKYGVVWLNPEVLAFPASGPDPNAINVGSRQGEGLSSRTLHYDYQMVVQGRNMASLLNHLRSWKDINLLGVPTVNGYTIAGNSPNLTATYALTMTIILRDAEKNPSVDPRVGGSSGGGGGGGGGFGGGPGRGFGPGPGGGMMGPGGGGMGRMGPGGGGMSSGGQGLQTAGPGMMGGPPGPGGMSSGGGR